jgi:hypothetical protein
MLPGATSRETGWPRSVITVGVRERAALRTSRPVAAWSCLIVRVVGMVSRCYLVPIRQFSDRQNTVGQLPCYYTLMGVIANARPAPNAPTDLREIQLFSRVTDASPISPLPICAIRAVLPE